MQIDRAVKAGLYGAVGADQTQDWHAAAASALEWWRDAGVDTLVDDMPRDWLAKTAAAAVPAERAPAVPALPDTLASFVAWRGSPDTPDAGWAGPRIVAQGDPACGLMIVVDCPDEDGLVTGAAGRLFDRMLAAIGRQRSSVYLAPLATARPLAGRIAAEAEAALAPLLRQHVALVAPRRLLVLGTAASRALHGPDSAPPRATLQPVNLNGVTVETVIGFSPGVLLEHAVAKAESWRGLQMLMGGLR